MTVSDSEGLSYYSETSLQRMLAMESAQLRSARQQLCKAGLIIYEHPLYQVLSLELPLKASGVREPAPRLGQSLPAADILRRILEGAQ